MKQCFEILKGHRIGENTNSKFNDLTVVELMIV